MALPRRRLRTLHLFAGAGGGILADLLLGHVPVCAVELDPYCRRVLLARQRDGHLPRFPIWDDVCTFDGRPWRGSVDVVAGGFPCQPFSGAAHGNHTAIDLWPEMARVVGESRPAVVFAENVERRPVERAACDLFALGYSARFAMLSAALVGAPHPRDRWWVVAHADGDSKPRLPVHVEVAESSSIPPMALWREDYSRSVGVDDGGSSRMDRLRSIGNAQSPQVAALAWEILR